MRTTIQFNHDLPDGDEIALYVKVDLYIPQGTRSGRMAQDYDSDDVPEVEILEAHEVESGKPFPVSQLDQESVSDKAMKELV